MQLFIQYWHPIIQELKMIQIRKLNKINLIKKAKFDNLTVKLRKIIKYLQKRRCSRILMLLIILPEK